ncbi:MAG: DUF5788 family protein [Halodesulfurarchaeum sp.]
MSPRDREYLLERLEREAATVGASIPETIELGGEQVELARFVFEVGEPDGPDDAAVRALVSQLRSERRRRRKRLEDGSIDHEMGREIVETILGIDRALNVLSGDEKTDLTAKASRARQADRKRWVAFLKQVRGEDPPQTPNHSGGKDPW